MTDYYNDYNANNNYSEIISLAGRVLQSREVNELQSIIKNDIKELSEVFLTNGDIISGCQCIVKGNVATITSGKIYLNGKIHRTDEQEIQLSTKGTEYIGARIRQQIITPSEDVALRDPAVGYNNYQQDGGYRLKETVEFVRYTSLDTNELTQVFTFKDGKQEFAVTAQQGDATLTKVSDILARRTYEQSGNYSISGLQIETKNKSADTKSVYLSVTQGKAYIRGYEIEKLLSTEIAIDRPTKVNHVTGELHEFTTEIKKDEFGNIVYVDKDGNTKDSNGQPYTISSPNVTELRQTKLEYKLNQLYPSNVTEVVGEVEVELQPQTRNGSSDTDYIGVLENELDSSSVTTYPLVSGSIHVYKDREMTKEYKYNIDFRKSDVGEGITWLSPSKNLTPEQIAMGMSLRPQTGETYYVTFRYIRTFKAGKDYELSASDDSGQLSIVWLDKVTPSYSSKHPCLGTNFQVDYDYSLYRRDIVALDKNGQFKVFKGQEDILQRISPPQVSEEEYLIIGSVIIKPTLKGGTDSNVVTIINNYSRALSMFDLYNMLKRIEKLEYNMSTQDLDNEAMDGEDASKLSGIFTDGFRGFTKTDLNHPMFNATLDLDEQCLTLPFITTLISPTVQSGNVTRKADIIYPSFSEVKLFSQSAYSSFTVINSYDAFSAVPTVFVSPDVDNWIDESQVVYTDINTTSKIALRRWWYHVNEPWTEQQKQLWQSNGYANGVSTDDWDNIGHNMAQQTAYDSSAVVNTNITYMRENTILVEANNCGANTDNLIVCFDGVPVSMTPSEARFKGTTSGSLRSNAQGLTKGTFKIPANTTCGTKEIAIYAKTTPNLCGSASYTSVGMAQVGTVKVYRETIKPQSFAPLAQSFVFTDSDHILTSIGVYFKHKDVDNPIIVQVRNMVNGFPSTTVYTETTISADTVPYSDNGSKECKVTFRNPVYCKKDTPYCFTVLTNSSTDSIWVARTNETNMTNKSTIQKNVYIDGMLFSSSNAVTWTAEQDTDMKFNLYVAKFNEDLSNEESTLNNTITFDTIKMPNEGDKFDRYLIVANTDIPDGCKMSWESRTDTDEWLPTATYTDKELSKPIEQVQFKVQFYSSNQWVAPALSTTSQLIALLKNKTSLSYISRQIYSDDGFNAVKVLVDIAEKPNVNYNVQISTENGAYSEENWITLESTGESKIISDTYREKEFIIATPDHILDTTEHNFRVRVIASTINSAVIPKVQRLRCVLYNE